MTRPALLLLAAAALGAAGCSNIPAGGDPSEDASVRALARPGAPSLGKLAVAPVTSIGLAADEAAKGWRPEQSEKLDPGAIGADLARALSVTRRFERVRPAAAADPLADAWRERDDLVLGLEVQELRTSYDGRNGWWIPNIANWLFWMVPAWWVATEEYSLRCDAAVTVTSAQSRTVVLRDRVSVTVQGTFDEFDRGWHFFGFVYTPLDPDRWRTIASRLFPEARRRLVVEATRRACEGLETVVKAESFAAATRKTLVLSVGTGRYLNGTRYPPVPFASEDARAVSDVALAAGVAREQVVTLQDSSATAAAVTSAAREHLARASDGDSVLIYVAGYGARGARGAPRLLFHDAGDKEGGLSLAELAALLAPVRGQKLLIIDAAFDGGARSVSGESAGGGDDLNELLSEVPGLTAILAASPGEGAAAVEHARRGLLTAHLVAGLRGPADTSHDGRVSAQELFAYVRPRVIAEAALAGAKQTPWAAGLDREVSLPAAASKVAQ